MSEPRELALLTKAEQFLAEVRTFDEVKDLRDKAEAAKAYARKTGLSKDIILHAAAIKVQAERRMGEILKVLELAKGAGGNQYTGKQLDRSQYATGSFRLRDLGITKSDSSRAQQIASLPAATFNRYVRQSVESGIEPSTAGLLRLAKQQAVNATVVPKSELPARFCGDLYELISTGRRFATIYADPPWRYDNQGTRAATNNHYPTMTIEQIVSEGCGLSDARVFGWFSNVKVGNWGSLEPSTTALLRTWAVLLRKMAGNHRNCAPPEGPHPL